MSDLCDPPTPPQPAGVRGDSLALGVLHAALLLGPAHPVELPPDPLRSSQSGPGESGADRTTAARSPWLATFHPLNLAFFDEGKAIVTTACSQREKRWCLFP